MPGSIDNTAQDLFQKLRNRFPKINMGDESGNDTIDPAEAKFFNFDFEISEIKFGTVTIGLTDQSLRLFFSTSITKYMDPEDKSEWYDFLKEIRRFSKSHLLGLDVRDITKDALTQKDLTFMTKSGLKKTIGESRVQWARRGKISEGNLNNVRIHVVHNERMSENNHNRLLKVDRIFLVNESGEKFLLPFKSVTAAKAMANHVARGGTPYDPSGKLISGAVNEMANLRRFAGATRRRTFESESANEVIKATAAIKEEIKKNIHKLANNSRFEENMEDLGKIMAEQTDVQDIKPFFIQSEYNNKLDDWMSSAARAYSQYKGNIMESLKESAGSVAEKLKNKDWNLVLTSDPNGDKLIVTSKYADGKALLRRILGTISDRLGGGDDDVANWASRIGQEMDERGGASKEDMQLALQLAKRYQQDLAKINSDPSYEETVRSPAFGGADTEEEFGDDDGEDFGDGEAPEKPEDKFESFINGIGEEVEELDELKGIKDPKVKDDYIRRASGEFTMANHARRVTQPDTPEHEFWKRKERNRRKGISRAYGPETDEGVEENSEWEYDREGEEEVMMDEIDADEEGMDMAVEGEDDQQVISQLTDPADLKTYNNLGQNEKKILSQLTDPADVKMYIKMRKQRDANPMYARRLPGEDPGSNGQPNSEWEAYDAELRALRKKLVQKYNIVQEEEEDSEWEYDREGDMENADDSDDERSEMEIKNVNEGREVNPMNDSLALMKRLAGLG